jgi:hypothetical protein
VNTSTFTFIGMPLEELRIDAVESVPGGIEHMRERRVKVIGWSTSADRLVKTWLWPWDLDEGVWLIGSATEANTSDAKRYKEAL